MTTSRLTDDDVRRSLGPQPMTGRRPTSPAKIDQRLQQVIKESNAWLRLFREVWFYPVESMLDLAVGAGEHPDLPASYDEAIDLMRWIAASAEYAQDKLEQGKAKAKKKRADMVKKTGEPKPRSLSKARRR